MTVSIGGAAIVPQRDMQISYLIARADKALYQAKHDGRNRVCCDLLEEEAPGPATPALSKLRARIKVFAARGAGSSASRSP